MLRIIVLVGAVVCLSLVLPVGGSAQDDLLVAAQAPGPELCTLEPRTIDELQVLVENRTRPVAPMASPTAVPDPFEMPEGFSLFEDERIEVEKDLVRAVSCFNTGDPLKVFATYTDAYVLHLIDELGGLTDEVEAGLTTVRPLEPSEYIQIINIDEAMLLNDGRIAVVVAGDDPANAIPPASRLFYLKEVLPGRWLIDEVVEINTG